ncbi:MAG: class B sortase [Bacilli bacterium]|nr:class B sortase [Bacilli bacterium]
MNNVLIRVNSKLLTLTHVKSKENKNLNNTNIIDTKELLFSYQYIKDNIELVSSFLNTIIIKNSIDKVRINNIELTTLTLDLINSFKNIKKLLISDDKSITYDIFLKLLDNNTLEYINCYDIPPYLLERLDINKNLKIEVRCEIFFMSKFMEDNKLNNYSDIYYKKKVVINKNFDLKELEEFKTFLRINKYLKEIHIKNYTNDLIYSIIDLFKENNIINKNIIFYEKNNINIIVNSINYLKDIYKDYLNESNIDFKIVYSKEYKKKNFFKQLNFVTLKYICIVVLLGALLFSGLDYYKNYTSEKKLNKIDETLTNILDNFELPNIDNENDDDILYIDSEENEEDNNTTNQNTTTKPEPPSSYYTKYEQIFEELGKINDETVGWLTVNNTKINYPVVQHTDNDYYLKRDFNKKNNSYGWVYMDYRNNVYNMSNNTIIYAHNLKNGMMFGTLRYATNESWYKNEENQIITFNTKVKNMKWKIFSIYKVPETNDYLYANFGDLDEYQTFIDFLKNRSMYDFNVEVTKDDHILTLSTCGTTSAQRLVIHAVLIKE